MASSIDLTDKNTPPRPEWRDVALAYRQAGDMPRDSVQAIAAALTAADALFDQVATRVNAAGEPPSHRVWLAADGWRWRARISSDITFGATEGVEHRLDAVRAAAENAAARGGDLWIHESDIDSPATNTDPRQVLTILGNPRARR